VSQEKVEGFERPLVSFLTNSAEEFFAGRGNPPLRYRDKIVAKIGTKLAPLPGANSLRTELSGKWTQLRGEVRSLLLCLKKASSEWLHA
jgi:hypothetical protein